ncbi:hypothetical protein [Silvanigrella sp.]|jgi:hypothetical protein|uniref:hypothetical protein n=1 Tax=Silvanigrella sp. TaxID=2024976 RepID=UPI0037CC8455
MAANLLADFFARFTIQFDKSTLSAFENSMSKGRENVDKYAQSVEKLSGVLQKLKFVLAGYLGFEGIKSTFKVNAEYENAKNQLINATKSEDISTKQLEKVTQFALKSKMSIAALTEEYGKFQQQMSFSDISVDKSYDIYTKLQIAYAGANIKNKETLQRVQKGVTDFIAGTASMAELKQRELGDDTIILQEIEKRLGGKKVADAKLKAMTAEQRAELISDSGYSLYKDGVEAYYKSPTAALQNFKNQIYMIQKTIGEAGFTKLAVQALDMFSSALSKLNPLIRITSDFIHGIAEAFDKVPVVMWSVVGAIGALTLALNANKIALLANIVVTNALIIADGALAIAAGTATIAEILMTLPLWLIVAGVLAVIAVIGLLAEDIYGYFHGKNSVTGKVVAKLRELFSEFGTWIEEIGVKISNWIYDHTIGWIKKFEAFGTKFSKWISEKTKSWVKKFGEFGTKISLEIYSAFNRVKDFLLGIFIYIKDKYFQYVVEPILAMSSKISGVFSKIFSGVSDKFRRFKPKISLDDVNNIMGTIIPKVEHFTEYRSQQPLIYPTQKPINNVTNTFSPKLSFDIVSNNHHQTDEKFLANKIRDYVDDTFTSHYSLAMADATSRE